MKVLFTVLSIFSFSVSAENLGQRLLAKFEQATPINIEAELGVWKGNCSRISDGKTKLAYWVLRKVAQQTPEAGPLQPSVTTFFYQSFEAPVTLYKQTTGEVVAVGMQFTGDREAPDFGYHPVSVGMTTQTNISNWRQVWHSAVKKSDNYLIVAVMKKSTKGGRSEGPFVPTEMCYFYEKYTGVKFYDQDVTADYYHLDYKSKNRQIYGHTMDHF